MIFKNIYMRRKVGTKGRREIGKIIFIKTFINGGGTAFISLLPLRHILVTLSDLIYFSRRFKLT